MCIYNIYVKYVALWLWVGIVAACLLSIYFPSCSRAPIGVSIFHLTPWVAWKELYLPLEGQHPRISER